MWERGWSFIKKAGSVILISTIVVWFTSFFGWAEDGQLTMTNGETVNHTEVVDWYNEMKRLGFKIRIIGQDKKFAREMR